MLKPRHHLHRDKGAILVVSLVVLVVMTLLVLGMLRTAVLELKIGGVTHQEELNFSNAESMLFRYLQENNGRFLHGCLGAAPDCFRTADPGTTVTNHFTTTQEMAKDMLMPYPNDQQGSRVVLTAQEIACGDNVGLGSGNQVAPGGPQVVFFNVRSEARTPVVGLLPSGRVRVHLGVRSDILPGSCGGP